MIQKLLKFILFLFICIIYLLFPLKSETFGNIKSDYKIFYTINEAGTAHAELDIALTNLTKDHFASSYQIHVGFDEIENIKASTIAGPINATINKTEKGYDILLSFDKKTVGLGAKLPIKLSFDTENVARKTGGIWELNIPGFANPDEFSSFTVEVKHPASFGEPAYVKPQTKNNILTFDKKLLGKSGISIAFGERKIYEFDLEYHLKNSNLFPVKSEIALPPDTNYQKIFIKSIKPHPENIIIDADGNWIAEYSLKPSEVKNITVTGSGYVNLSPEKSDLSEDEKKIYTMATKNWQADDPDIQKLAKQLKTPKAIYNYVTDTLKYDYSRVDKKLERLGGLDALKNPKSAVCLEFADSFITLARAAGIPAREVDGYAYTNDPRTRPLSLIEDILHSWPEYYDFDKKAWIMIDPTWGNTTGGIDYFDVLDFNHLAFVIKGTRDDSPIPAGGYKWGKDTTAKDVKVSFSDEFPKVKQEIVFSPTKTNENIAGFPITTSMKITNRSGSATSRQPMYIKNSDLLPLDQALEIPPIPPYGTIIVEVNFNSTHFLTNKQVSTTILFGDNTHTQTVTVSPFYLTTIGKVGAGFGIFTIIILIIAGKSRSLRIFR